MAFLTIEDRLGELELVIFPKVLEKHTYFLSPDIPIAAVGELSFTEDAPPKLLVSDVAVLQADFSGEVQPLEKPRYNEKKKAAVNNTVETPTPSSAPSPTPTAQKPKTLYLKVPNMQSDACRRACAILEIFEGNTPVIFYDASTKKYIKAIGRSTEILPNMFRLLQDILGQDAVIYK
jgi:DNA polymerase-3 subunit alpha